jgi:hypothetical protein
MFGRTIKIAVLIGLTQIGSGCCWCWRPFFCHGCWGGCGGGVAPCTSCYSPTAAPGTPVIAPFPTAATVPNATVMPPAAGAAQNTGAVAPYSSANYTHPVR